MADPEPKLGPRLHRHRDRQGKLVGNGLDLPSGQTCHLEYCLTQDAPSQGGGLLDCSATQNPWQHTLTTFTLQGPPGMIPNGNTALNNAVATVNDRANPPGATVGASPP